MWMTSLRKIDNIIRRSATGKIVVYFAAMLSIMAVPAIILSQIKALDNHEQLNEVLFEGVFASSAVLALLLMRKGPDPRPLSDYGYSAHGIISQTAVGAGIGLAIMSVVMNLLRATKVYQVVGINKDFSPVLPALMFLFVAVAEETVFRGYVFNTLEKNVGTLVALSATSLVFGLAHLIDLVPGISFAEHLKASLFLSLEAGVLFNAAFLVTRRLWINIGIHWAWNFFQGPFFGATVSGTPELSTLYQARFTGPNLITGGAFGPEASIYCLVIATAAGVLMLIIAARRGQWRPGPNAAITQH